MPQSAQQKKDNVTPEPTGWFLPEVAHPWALWKAKGYEMTFVSPKGGFADCVMSSVRDYAKDEECIAFTKAMMNEKSQVETIKVSEIKDLETYDAIFYTGGHGTMFDFPDCEGQNKAATAIYEAGYCECSMSWTRWFG